MHIKICCILLFCLCTIINAQALVASIDDHLNLRALPNLGFDHTSYIVEFTPEEITMYETDNYTVAYSVAPVNPEASYYYVDYVLNDLDQNGHPELVIVENGAPIENGGVVKILDMGSGDILFSHQTEEGNVATEAFVNSGGHWSIIVRSFTENIQPVWIYDLELDVSAFENTYFRSNSENSVIRSFPNPFNEGTTIEYGISDESAVLIRIYDLKGREVISRNLDRQSPGTHTYSWNGMNGEGKLMPSGAYTVSVLAGKRQISRSILLIK